MFNRTTLLASLLLTACGGLAVDERGEEDLLPEDDKLDSFYKPTNHGAIATGGTATGELTATQFHHTWDFTLTGQAAIKVTTAAATSGGPEVDTVLYLYKEKSTGGWGAYLYRNDNTNSSTRYSTLARTLEAGHYRILVKGYKSTTRGAFAVTAGCTGAGCNVAPPVAPCLLGATYNELMGMPETTFGMFRNERLTSADSLTSIERDQVVMALHQSSHKDVVTVEEAFARVDGHEINLSEQQHQKTGQIFITVEYGAGGNSYGAVFYYKTFELAATLHDGDLEQCKFVTPEGGKKEGELCGAPTACVTGLRCQGITGGRGVCVPRADPAGDEARCSATTPCPGTQLICAGLTRSDDGMCLPEWYRRSFEESGSFAIPDAGAVGLKRSLTAYGLTTVDMDVVLRASIRHSRLRDLRVTLDNGAGSGNEVLVFDGATAPSSVVDGKTSLELDGPVRFSGDESVNGAWTLRVVDSKSGTVGQLTSWKLTLTSRWD